MTKEEDLIKCQRRQISYVGLAAALFLVLPLLVQAALVLFFSVFSVLIGDIVDFFGASGMLIMSSVSMYLVAFPLSAAVMWLIPKCGEPQREVWGMGRFFICLVMGTGLGFAGGLLAQLAEAMGAGSANAEELTELMMDTNVWINVLCTVLIGPAVEEIFYRKLVMDRLLGFGQLPAILLSAAMFALAHGNFSQFFYAFALGILWGYVYAKTGRIGYTIAFHMIFNFFGSVLVLELTKLMNGSLGDIWLVKQLEWVFELDEGVLAGVLSAAGETAASLFFSIYGLVVLGCFVAVMVLLVVLRKKICFEPGQWPIKKGNVFRTVFLNAGVVLYLVFCAGLFWWNS